MQTPSKNSFQYVTVERDTRLRVEVKLLFRDLYHIVLGCISKAIDDLDCYCLFIREALNLPFRKAFADALVETKRLSRTRFTNSSAFLQDRRLKQQFERPIQENEYDLLASPIPRAVKLFDGENERIG